MISLEIELLINLLGFRKIRNKIIQKQLQMNMIKKYLEKETYFPWIYFRGLEICNDMQCV